MLGGRLQQDSRPPQDKHECADGTVMMSDSYELTRTLGLRREGPPLREGMCYAACCV